MTNKAQTYFYDVFGNPLTDRKNFEKKFMTVYSYPLIIRENIPVLGKSLYCNINFVAIYELFLLLLIERGLHKEIKTNDECFNVRDVRGIKGLLSIHSWGMAVDLNAKDNPLGVSREQALKRGLTPFTKEFIQCAIDSGLVAGYYFSRFDLMHFEHTGYI